MRERSERILASVEIGEGEEVRLLLDLEEERERTRG